MVPVINTVDTSHEDMIHEAQMDYCGTRLATCSSDRVVVYSCGSVVMPQAILHKFNDAVWHVSQSITANIQAISGGDNKVTLWKESVHGQWMCISDVNKGQGSMSVSLREGQQNEQ
ncbi:hypothetical protein QTO34_007938 [Cnephaeus nilssonii]|uniref:Protein SEC13 homolog n=1 Tax=Cnephaeus nilssonii TaxID=3371016 RepID=A0AA40LTB5_CNENI|nr:hypothetical protein QTO34_007938 [Eptesicus nilssonii]